jgi:hypothetical protein
MKEKAHGETEKPAIPPLLLLAEQLWLPSLDSTNLPVFQLFEIAMAGELRLVA